jgi:hypothetical protein
MANIWTEGSASALAILKFLLERLEANGGLQPGDRDQIINDAKALLTAKGPDFSGSADLTNLAR